MPYIYTPGSFAALQQCAVYYIARNRISRLFEMRLFNYDAHTSNSYITQYKKKNVRSIKKRKSFRLSMPIHVYTQLYARRRQGCEQILIRASPKFRAAYTSCIYIFAKCRALRTRYTLDSAFIGGKKESAAYTYVNWLFNRSAVYAAAAEARLCCAAKEREYVGAGSYIYTHIESRLPRARGASCEREGRPMEELKQQ